ncbi:MAG: hypothetical protein HS113_04495 [Verrucomicrobiales bacterium]|nr:hypothetical protein [Verrucomicrobiales bacterium]
MKELFLPEQAVAEARREVGEHVPVKFFHNDAPCAASLAHYAELGINLYNPGIQTTFPELRR